MKKVFSLFVAVLVIVVGLFSFVGCSPKEADKTALFFVQEVLKTR